MLNDIARLSAVLFSKWNPDARDFHFFENHTSSLWPWQCLHTCIIHVLFIVAYGVRWGWRPHTTLCVQRRHHYQRYNWQVKLDSAKHPLATEWHTTYFTIRIHFKVKTVQFDMFTLSCITMMVWSDGDYILLSLIMRVRCFTITLMLKRMCNNCGRYAFKFLLKVNHMFLN